MSLLFLGGAGAFAQTPDSSKVITITEAQLSRAIENGVRTALETRDAEAAAKDSAQTAYERYVQRQNQKGRRLQRVDRDAMRALFVPKGQWMFGGSVSFNEWDNDNMNELVLKNIDVKGHTFNASPYLCYFISDNFAVGGRFNYNRYYLNTGNFDLNLGEDFNISLKDLYYLEHSFEFGPFVRLYMPLDRSKVFAFFSEVRLTYTYGRGKNTSGTGAEFDGTFEEVHKAQLGFCPGLTAFVNDFMAIECSVGMMGVSYKWTNQNTNRVETGKSQSGGANFKINLFSVSIGASFYL